MTKDEIIAMAREAGFVVDELSMQHQPNCIFHTNYMVDQLLERFAKLVAEREREMCAKVCEDSADAGSIGYVGFGGLRCAATIRARGEA